MSGVKDSFEILADEITLIRRQVDQLQRTSLNKDEAEAFNATIAKFLTQLGKTALDVRAYAGEAAGTAAREAIKKSHAEKVSEPRKASHRPPERPAGRPGAILAGFLGMVGLDRSRRGASGRAGSLLDHRQRRCPRVRPVPPHLLRIGRRSGR